MVGLKAIAIVGATLILSPFLWLAVTVAPLVVLDGPLTLVFLMLEDTHYPPGYSHWRFLSVQPGMSRSQVLERLGAPFGEVWEYPPSGGIPPDDFIGFDASGRVDDPSHPSKMGWSVAEVESALGRPTRIHLQYSRRELDTNYRTRAVVLSGDRVERRRSSLYVD